jgi:hypothetical protein
MRTTLSQSILDEVVKNPANFAELTTYFQLAESWTRC